MRLVLLFTWDVSLAEWKRKGLLQRELKLYQALVDQGLEIVLATWGGEEDAQIAKEYSQFTVLPLYIRIPAPKNKALRWLCSLLAPFHMKYVITKDTVIKTNQMWGSWAAVMVKYLYSRPLLLRCGFELYDFTLKGAYDELRKNFIRAISYLGYKAADHIFVATGADKAFVEKEFGIRDDKISICPNWIDTDLFSPSAAGPNNGRVLFVGRLNAQKNLPALVDAIAQTPYGLDIVGGGELEGALKKQVLELEADVRFLGNVPNDHLPNLYSGYALYILPSFYEGNPKTLLEAMACSALVLGTNVPGIREVVAHGETGYLCETDAKSIAEGIRGALSSPEAGKVMGNKARSGILAHNTLAAQVAREVKSVQTLLTR